MYPTSEHAMKMEIPLPCLYPSPFLNKSSHNFTSSSTLPHSLSLSLSLSPLSSSHPRSRPSAITISPSFPTSSISFSSSSTFDKSASIPLSFSPTHTPTNNQLNNQHTQDGHLNTTHNTHTELSHNAPYSATIKTVLDSSIMATSMDIVRAWRHRRCIDVDFVLGCRTTSDDAENVRHDMTSVLNFDYVFLFSLRFQLLFLLFSETVGNQIMSTFTYSVSHSISQPLTHSLTKSFFAKYSSAFYCFYTNSHINSRDVPKKSCNSL